MSFKKSCVPWNKGKKGVQVAWNKGLNWSDESKEKMRLGHLGKPGWNKGLTTSPEVRLKISVGTKLAMSDDSVKVKMRNAKLGKKLDIQHRDKIRQTLIGRPVSDATKQKISKANTGRPKTKETLLKMSLAMRGKNSGPESHLWKGGITPINEKIRKSPEYKLWRKAVFERDNYTCTTCMVRGVTIHADHIKPFCLFPELRFSVENGRTLCVPCHRNTSTWGSKVYKYKQNQT